MSRPYKDKYHLEGGELIRQVTFGANDGIVSVFALLAGVAGAGQEAKIILISMLAATIAGALSMAAGEYISGKGEYEYFSHEQEQEYIEIQLTPEIEKEELRLIYAEKGFKGEILDQIVDTISKDEDLWVKEMMIAELGEAEVGAAPKLKTAFIILISFILGALFPVLPYALLFSTDLSPIQMFYLATAVTVVGLFLVGAFKTYVTGKIWWKSGLEMLLVGAFAFTVAYLTGTLFNL